MQYIYLAYACSKSIIKSLQQRAWRTSFVFLDNFELVFALLLYPSLLLVKSRRFYQQEIVKLLTEKYQYPKLLVKTLHPKVYLRPCETTIMCFLQK